MPIDTTVQGSPGWHIERLVRKLEKRKLHLADLSRWLEGNAPLPEGTESAKRAYAALQRMARSGFAELIVEAVRERMRLVGFRTAAAGDENGDALAAQIWAENGMDIESADVHDMMLGLANGYAIVGLNAATGRPIITGEDPKQVITEHDPTNPQVALRGLKSFYDEESQRDVIYLYDGNGKVYVAFRKRSARTVAASPKFSASAFEWDPERGGAEGEQLPAAVCPVVRFQNRRGVGEFENHTDLLERINTMILQRMSVAVMQAYRQRALKGDLPEKDDDGNVINYDEIFEAGPGALWRLPEGVDLWESAVGDLTPILASAKADLEHLGAITRTPLYALFPDATNQTAEGASLAREGLVYKVEDRMARAGASWARVMSLAFLFMGETERADVARIQPIWAPAERFSLAERGSASSQAVDMPFETKLREIWQFTPDQIARAKTERMDDVLAQQLAALKANAAAPAGSAPAPVPVGG
ncbi:MAG: bacteriophage adsorption protein [Frankiales bacterium]|nr:bacteriophage adsorption protein [Frankiales bacterium]